MKTKSHRVLEIKKSLQKIESEAAKLKKLTQDIPAVQKNINPILAFIDILKYHLGDLKS